MEHTIKQFDNILSECTEVFTKKLTDYGASWRIFRVNSLIDQIFIKANRIRTLQETNKNLVGDTTHDEWQAIINYSVITLIQIKHDYVNSPDMDFDTALMNYTDFLNETKKLMICKNHDYGEAWRDMSDESFVDMILVKLARIRQINSNEGLTIISEGIDANLFDIINYSVFALIKMSENSFGCIDLDFTDESE